VCVLQLLSSGDMVEVDLKAPRRHSSCPPPAAWHRTVYAYTRVRHSLSPQDPLGALCLVTRTHAHTAAHPARSERAARSRSSELTRAYIALEVNIASALTAMGKPHLGVRPAVFTV
jgi:hypothetical protein